MIFQATWRQVLDGSKTQTRRIVGPNDDWLAGADYPAHWHSFFEDGHPMVAFPLSEIGDCPISVVTTNERVKWRVGDDYAVQSGRNKPAVWRRRAMNGDLEIAHGKPGAFCGNSWRETRIRITRIRQERVQDISEADAIAEGVTWNMPSPEGWPAQARNGLVAKYAALWDTLHDKPGERWADNPAVWVLEFELVEAA